MNTHKIKQKAHELINLIDELEKVKDSKKYEYYIQKEFSQHSTLFYSIYNNKTNKLIKIDTLPRIKSYLNIRNITTSNINELN